MLRRSLRLHSLDDVIRAAEEAATAEDVELLGNWSVGQILQHLAKSVDSSFNESKAALPRWRLALGRLAKPLLLRLGLPAGVRIDQVSAVAAAEFLPDADVSAADGLRELQRVLRRACQQQMVARHNIFGPMSHADWVRMHCRHAELHLSFIVLQSEHQAVDTATCL